MTRERWIAVLLVLLGFVLRVHHLARSELSGDEEYSYLAVNQAAGDVIAYNHAQSEPHPVLSYYIQQFSYTFGGNNEIAVRLPSALFGALSVAATYQLMRAVRRGVPRGASVLATSLVAIQSLAVKSSREMRMYSMGMALSLAASVVMLRLLRKPTRVAWLLYVLVSAAALQVHYYTGFVLVAHNAVAAWLLATRRLKNPRKAVTWWIAAQLAVALITLPWLIYVRDVLTQYGGNESRTSLVAAPFQAAGWLTLGAYPPDWLYPAGGLVLALLALGLIRMLRARRESIASIVTLWLLLGVPLGITVLAARNRNIWAERYVNNAVPYLLALLSVTVIPGVLSGPSLRQTLARVSGYAATGVVVAILAIGQIGFIVNEVAPPFTPRRNFAQMVGRYSLSRPTAQIRVVSNYPESTLGMYYLSGPELVTVPARGNDLESARNLVGAMRAAGVRRVIFRQVDALWDSQNVAEQALRENYHLIREDFTGSWILKIFGHAELADLHSVQAMFVNGMRINSADALADAEARMVEIYLTWSVSGHRSGTEKVFMHVTEAANPEALIAQGDYPLVDADFGGDVRSYGFKFRDDAVLQAGRYVVRVGVYDPARPGAPRVGVMEGGDSLILAEFDVK